MIIIIIKFKIIDLERNHSINENTVNLNSLCNNNNNNDNSYNK